MARRCGDGRMRAGLCEARRPSVRAPSVWSSACCAMIILPGRPQRHPWLVGGLGRFIAPHRSEARPRRSRREARAGRTSRSSWRCYYGPHSAERAGETDSFRCRTDVEVRRVCLARHARPYASRSDVTDVRTESSPSPQRTASQNALCSLRPWREIVRDGVRRV